MNKSDPDWTRFFLLHRWQTDKSSLFILFRQKYGFFTRVMKPVAGLVALLLIVQGILGGFFRTPPMVYVAAALRVVFGIVLLGAAPKSRMPGFLRVFGFIILIGGVVTPFVGVRFAHSILAWWAARGPALVRVFAGVSLALGIFAGYAIAPKRTAF